MDSLEIIDCISYIAGALSAAVFAALLFRRAQKSKESSLLYYLLTGFYSCIFMSDVFYLLTWVVEDYPFVFSPGDISWVGGLLFLITVAMSLMDGWTPQQKSAAKKYMLSALLALAVCLGFNIAYVSIYPDIIINYLLYGVPTAILAYVSLWLFLSGYKGGIRPAMKQYHLTALAWIAVQLFYDLFSTLGWDYGYAVPFVICSWLLTLTAPGLYFAARKEAAE